VNKGIPRKKGRRKKKAKTIDLKALAQQYRDGIIEALGIDYLGLKPSLMDEIVRDILDAVITSTSYKPSLDTIVKRINRYRRRLYKIVAAKILEDTSRLSEQQVEFIIAYGEEVAAQYVSELYRAIKSIGREDLVDALRYIWEKYGRPTPVSCPKCGFRAVMPDLSCLVCGYVVTEDYVREAIGFNEKFELFLKNSSVAVLQQVLDLGFVVVSDVDIRSPREKIDTFIRYYYPVYLKPNELSAILEEISSRKIKV